MEVLTTVKTDALAIHKSLAVSLVSEKRDIRNRAVGHLLG